MRLGKVLINNFRSISETTVEFDNNITAFVGYNASGKTNILLAINKFITNAEFDFSDIRQHSKEDTSIEIELLGTTEKDKIFISTLLTTVSGKYGSVSILKNSNGYFLKTPKPTDSNNEQNQPSADLAQLSEEQKSALLPLLPKCVFISAFKAVLRGKNIDIGLDVNKISEEEASIVKRFLDIGGLEMSNFRNPDLNQMAIDLNRGARVISDKLSESWKQGTINIRIISDQNQFCIHFLDLKNEKDVWTPPEDRSLGFQWFITFYAILTALAKEEGSSVVLIDDAGSPFHAEAQLSLYQEFQDIASKGKCQIAYATHSPYMLNKNNKKEIYYIVQESDKGSYALKYEDWKILKSLPSPLREIGFSNAFDLVSDKVIVFEGRTDKISFEKFISLYPDPAISSFHTESGGGWPDAIDLSLKLKEEGRPYLALLDSDVEEAITSARDKKIKYLDIASMVANQKREIETVEDILPINIYLDSFNLAGNEYFPDWIKITNRHWRKNRRGIISFLKQKVIDQGKDWEKFMFTKKLQIVKNCLDQFGENNLDNDVKKDIKKYLLAIRNHL